MYYDNGHLLLSHSFFKVCYSFDNYIACFALVAGQINLYKYVS